MTSPRQEIKMMMQPEHIDQQIAALETLYRQLTGASFTKGDQPYAPIPPEADPEAYVLEQLEELQSTLAGFTGRPAATPVAPSRINVLESDKAWTYRFDVSGVAKPDVTARIEAGILRVSAVRRGETNGHRPVHLEVAPGRLERSVPLPRNANPETAYAKLENGLLSVRFEKGAVPPTRGDTKIEIH